MQNFTSQKFRAEFHPEAEQISRTKKMCMSQNFRTEAESISMTKKYNGGMKKSVSNEILNVIM